MRYSVVTDLPEYTVHDREHGRDLFPTKSGNRDYSCRACIETDAKLIADALNGAEQLEKENERLREALKEILKMDGFCPLNLAKDIARKAIKENE